MKRVSLMVVLAIAVVMVLTGCLSVAKTRSLVGAWNLSVIRSESETFTAFIQISTHDKGKLSGYLGNRIYTANYGTISGPLPRTTSPFSTQAMREEKQFNLQASSTQLG